MIEVDWKVNAIEVMYKGYLSDILCPILADKPIRLPVAIDVVISIIGINLDLFGFLYKGGRNTSLNAVAFIREYLGRTDSRYREIGGLLYHMLRHGWVHRFSPKRLTLCNGKILDFEFSCSKNRDEHLVIRRGETKEPRLLINVPLLCEDTLSALDFYAEDVGNNSCLAGNFKNAFYRRREPENESQVRKRTYLEDSDFNFIYNQIP